MSFLEVKDFISVFSSSKCYEFWGVESGSLREWGWGSMGKPVPHVVVGVVMLLEGLWSLVLGLESLVLSLGSQKASPIIIEILQYPPCAESGHLRRNGPSRYNNEKH